MSVHLKLYTIVADLQKFLLIITMCQNEWPSYWKHINKKFMFMTWRQRIVYIHQPLPFCKQTNTTVNNLLYMYIYTDWGWDYRNALRPSVCLSVTFRVRAITYVCIDGLPSNSVQMLSSLRRCAVTLTRIHTSKVKVTQDI